MHEYLEDVPQIITVIAVKEMVPEATEVMTKHGCTITFYDNYCEVQFPAGTTREEIIPRMLAKCTLQHCVAQWIFHDAGMGEGSRNEHFLL